MPGTLETRGVAVKALDVAVGGDAVGTFGIDADEELPPPPHPASASALAPITSHAKDDRIFFIRNLSIAEKGGARAPLPIP
jgi:hypothetical protein